MSVFATILASALNPIAKVLGKAAAKIALKLHKGPLHRYAEKLRQEDIAAGYDDLKPEGKNETTGSGSGADCDFGNDRRVSCVARGIRDGA